MVDLSGLFGVITSTLTVGAWTSLEKAQALAAIVIALRPTRIMEIGVWEGDSLLPQLLALRTIGSGAAIAVDPWQADASVVGQVGADAAWWGNTAGQSAHEAAYAKFLVRLVRHELADICHVIRAPSDEVSVEEVGVLDLLHVDGNHAEQAVRDVDRFARVVRPGGILVMDDLGWTGGHVRAAYDLAVSLGFVELYPLGSGCVLQRTASLLLPQG